MVNSTGVWLEATGWKVSYCPHAHLATCNLILRYFSVDFAETINQFCMLFLHFYLPILLEQFWNCEMDPYLRILLKINSFKHQVPKHIFHVCIRMVSPLPFAWFMNEPTALRSFVFFLPLYVLFKSLLNLTISTEVSLPCNKLIYILNPAPQQKSTSSHDAIWFVMKL